MDKLTQYAENQRRHYNEHSVSEEGAKRQVAEDYDRLQELAVKYAGFVLAQYILRKSGMVDPAQSEIAELNLLDVGCGVGRTMKAFRRLGCRNVDGCDISGEMLRHARSDPELSGCRLFLTSGADTGDSSSEYYDIVYSFLCFHHIPMRQTRIKILESMARNLRQGGMAFVELKLFPGATAAKIPMNHAHWAENMVAIKTNSESDVWVTPDSIGLVYDDFRLFFKDIAFIEVDVADDHYQYSPEAIYQFPFNEFYVIGSKGRLLQDAIAGA